MRNKIKKFEEMVAADLATLERLVLDHEEIERIHPHYGDSEVNRVWQGCIYGTILGIPVAVPMTRKGWKTWGDAKDLYCLINNTKKIIKIIEKYYLLPDELDEFLKPYLWRFID